MREVLTGRMLACLMIAASVAGVVEIARFAFAR